MGNGLVQRLKALLSGAHKPQPAADEDLIDGLMADDVIDEPAAYCYVFVSLATSDGSFDARERRVVTSLLCELCRVSPQAAQVMIDAALRRIQSFRGPAAFIAKIKEEFSPEEKQKIMAALDRIIDADGIVGQDEHYWRTLFGKLLS